LSHERQATVSRLLLAGTIWVLPHLPHTRDRALSAVWATIH
jgi:hypothetical protein